MEVKKEEKNDPQKKNGSVSCFVCKQQVPEEQTRPMRRNGKESVRVCVAHIKFS